jgi:hypothetical protein
VARGTLGTRVAGEGPLERLALVFPHDDDALVLRLVGALDAANRAAVPHAAALDTYELGAAEAAALAAHELDVVTGVHATDGAQRIVLLEGLGGPGRAMEAVRLALPPRPDPSDASLLVLANPAARWGARLWACGALVPRAVAVREARKDDRRLVAVDVVGVVELGERRADRAACAGSGAGV